MPNRRGALEQLKNGHPSLHRPVYFALTAYEENFHALSDFIRLRVDGLNDDQVEALVYAAIAQKFGQQPLPQSSFRRVFGLDRRERVDIERLFGERTPTAELFVEVDSVHWRIGHSLVADEILKQLLSTGNDPRSWVNRLGDWGERFVWFCRGLDGNVSPSREMRELVKRVFVLRDSVDILGTEQSSRKRFSDFIQQLPNDQAKLRVLNALVEGYPEESHFWAHLGRFHGLQRQEFEKALEALGEAVRLADGDAVVYHMRGMVYRVQLRNRVRNARKEDARVDDLVEIAERASQDFEESRRLDPENEHGYIAEAQMLLELLDYLGGGGGDILAYLARKDAPPYVRDALDGVEDLLGYVRRQREGRTGSEYEESLSAKVDELYGDYETALQRLDTLLGREDVYQPPVRRQLVRMYQRRAGGSWSDVKYKTVDRVTELLRRNMDEEPDDGRNVRLWMETSRFLRRPPSVEEALENVQYWRSGATASGAVDAVYYAYVLNALLAMEGSGRAVNDYQRYLEECRERTRFRRGRTRSYEWLGSGEGIARLVHQSRLGSWDSDGGFWGNTGPLRRVSARVARVDGPQAGVIEVEGGVRAFFVPDRARIVRGMENQRVGAYLGFSYEGPRAWSVDVDVRRGGDAGRSGEVGDTAR